MRPAVLSALLALCLATALPLRSSFAEAGPAATPSAATDGGAADSRAADAGTANNLQLQGETPSAGGLPTPDEGDITRIVVQGNRRVETDAVKNALPVKPGDTYNKAKIKATLIAVWRMGYFDDVRIDVSPLPVPQVGTVLTVIVVEKPAVHAVRFEGNDEISTEDLTKDNNVEVRQYQILDQEAVRRSVKKIQDKYIEKGFFLAEVTSRIDQKPNNEVDVVFIVSEHAKVMVKEVRFVGNKSISSAELKSQMVTTEGNLFSFFTSAGTYRDDAFQRDDYILQSMYYDRGFINVKFGKPAIELSPDKRFIYITFIIDEGEAYNVGKIDVGGDLLESKELLMSKIVLKPGDRFNRSQIGKDITALADVYKDKGYAYANVAPATGMDVAKKTVDLTYEMQKGNLVTIERIEVVGNSKTRDKVVRRELRIEEGQLYSSTLVKISKQRVTALGFFESVEINQRRGSTDDKMILEVAIKEKLTGTFQVGFGFTGGESFFGTAQVSQNNLLGYGTTGSLSVQLSSIRQLVQLSYLDPYLFDTFWTGSADLYRSQLIYTGFQRNTIGGAATIGYDLTNFARRDNWTHWLEDFHTFVTYTLEHLDVEATSTSNELLQNQFLSGLTSSVRLSFNYDRRDNRLFPTEGHLESGSAEFASSIFGSQNLFQRFRAIERRYFPLGNGMVFKFNINLGYIRTTDPVDHPLAISEKFFEGGINSLRGYNLYSISPVTRIASSLSPSAGVVDFAVGGNKELITNWEFEFPLVEAAGVRGVAFYDAGNVYSESEHFFQHETSSFGGAALPLGLFHSVGAGVRWFSPLGPLRFELGFPLTRREQDSAYQFEFTIGNFF